MGKEDFLSFVKTIQFLLSWCYFLTNLNELYIEYKGLQQISTSLRFIHKIFR